VGCSKKIAMNDMKNTKMIKRSRTAIACLSSTTATPNHCSAVYRAESCFKHRNESTEVGSLVILLSKNDQKVNPLTHRLIQN
jgi:hypothetical protein